MTGYGYRYDYSKTMMMKLFLSLPNVRDGGSVVNCTFEKALDVIRQTDALTLGAPKILYLVGWQYNGHDDRYPAFFEVNPALKRDCDPDARASLLWLIGEAKKYHTIVSLHVNFTDAYEDSPLWDTYVRAGALIRGRDGKPVPIEEYNGRPCYKVSVREEMDAGLFRERFDRLCRLVPLTEIGTVHADNFLACYNEAPEVDISDMQDARDSMIDYIRGLGIDVTSEFPYREGPSGRDSYSHSCMRAPSYPIRCLGRIPAVWWLDNMTDEDYLTLPPAYFGGGMSHNPAYADAFYGNIHGEELWSGERLASGAWAGEFLRQFAMIQLPYFYLCLHDRLRIENSEDGSKTAFFSDGIVSEGRGCRVTENGRVLKTDRYASLPVTWRKDACLIYSDDTAEREYFLPGMTDGEKRVSLVTPEGLLSRGTVRVSEGRAVLEVEGGTAVLAEGF